MSATAAAAPPDAAPAPSIIVAPIVALAAFMEVLDLSIANVSLQHIAGDLSATQDQATWVLTSYMVTNAIVLPIAGWMSTVIGRKRFFIACIIGFTLASLLCGLAPNLPMLIFFRACQGFAGGGLQPMSQSILADAFPPRQRGMAFALFGMAVVFAPAIGPTLGGILTDQASWRWVFLINVPVGVIVVSLLSAMIQDPPEQIQARAAKLAQGVKLDYLGFGLLAIGFGLLQIVLDKGQDSDWFSSPFILSLSIASAISIISFVLWELGQDDPIVDIHLLLNRNFGFANLLMVALGFVLMGSTVLIPILVQSLFGYTATDAGLVISPGGLVVMALMPVVGRLSDKVDGRWLLMMGMIITATAMFLCARVDLDATYTNFALLRMLQASGMAFLFIPLNTLAYRTVPREKNAQAASIINVSRNIGGAFGISLIVTQLSRMSQTHQTVLTGHATPLDQAYRSFMMTMTSMFEQQGDNLATATSKAMIQLSQLIGRQASMLSFLDDFRSLGILFTVLIPVILLMQGGTMRQRGGGAAH